LHTMLMLQVLGFSGERLQRLIRLPSSLPQDLP